VLAVNSDAHWYLVNHTECSDYNSGYSDEHLAASLDGDSNSGLHLSRTEETKAVNLSALIVGNCSALCSMRWLSWSEKKV